MLKNGKLLGLIYLLSVHLTWAVSGQPTHRDVQEVLDQINALRSKGCRCGGEEMPPAAPLVWDTKLYTSAREYARYMDRNDHFDHIDHYGRDLGDRLDKLEYKWMVFGENLGRGYQRFFEVLSAWKESPSHCKMLMNKEVTHMALSRYNKYWAMSLALPMPDPIATKYTELTQR